MEDENRCDHGKLNGTGICWACDQDDRAGAAVRAEREARKAVPPQD